MKAFFALMILMIGFVFAMPAWSAVDPPDQSQTYVIDQQHLAPAAMVQEEGGVQEFNDLQDGNGNQTGDTENSQKPIGELLFENWYDLLLALLTVYEVIVRITPTEKDNSIINWIIDLLNRLNFKKGGGTFKVRSNI